MISIPLVRSTRGAVVSVVLFALLCAACFTPLGLWGLAFLYLLGTCALCTVTLTAGLLPGVAGLALSILGMYGLLGEAGAACALEYLLPTYLLFLILYHKKVKFTATCAAMVLCQAVSQLAIFLMLNHQVGGNLFFRAGELAAAAIQGSEFCDTLLVSLAEYGLIGLSGDLADGAVTWTVQGYLLSDVARSELLLSLRELISTMLEALLPGMLISHSIEAGVLSAAWPIHQAGRKQQQLAAKGVNDARNPIVDRLQMLPVHTWHIPRPWGLRIAVLGLGYFLAMAESAALSMLGQMFFSLFSAVFSIQGIATLNFVQHKKGTRYGWRVALPIALSLLMPNALLFLGLMDQATNLRLLRPVKRFQDDHYSDNNDDNL